MNFLLDTPVISELVAQEPNPRVVHWIDSINEDRLFLSVITIGEIKRGIDKLPDAKRRQTSSEWLMEELLARFRGRILPIDIPVVLGWGQLVAELETQGRRMSALDSLIAASCFHRGLHLVTRNEDDLIRSGVTVINPWRP